jgi:hypothetical protein
MRLRVHPAKELSGLCSGGCEPFHGLTSSRISVAASATKTTVDSKTFSTRLVNTLDTPCTSAVTKSVTKAPRDGAARAGTDETSAPW